MSQSVERPAVASSPPDAARPMAGAAAACDTAAGDTAASDLAASELAARYDAQVPRYTSYPTAPHFHKGIGDAEYRSWLAAIDPGRPVSLYVHIPFCSQLCWYCGCNTRVVNSHKPIGQYVDTLLSEIALAAAAIGQRLPVAAVHFGGGTPNVLSAADLDRIFDALRWSFRLLPEAEIASEIDPRELTPAWVEAAARNGLNRASVGVQDVDAAVQAAINRQQPWAVTEAAVMALRQAGVPSVNLDLLYGLPHQTVATLAETIEQILHVQPDRIALFGYAHVPWMKPAQKLLPEEALPGSVERHAQQVVAADLLARAGYMRIGLDHFARGDDPLTLAVAAGEVHRNFQGYTTDGAETLLGFGASSIGRLHGGYVQNHAAVVDWRSDLREGRLPVARGIALTEDDRLRGSIIEQLMCGFQVDLGAFVDRPGLAGDRFASELERLEPFVSDGLLARDGWRLVATERGRPFIRSMCAVFDRYLKLGKGRHSRGV